ncbi:S41 family peptidase [uncultured Polaribacter sp.]|uniref:S41 family peptidase n=1 Tax=uncultured Polaribacter sp. TaxID=174711 RepID=UPI00259AFF9C|nr:S41 family peptidase [uncultured Polaribacter sp.]
MKNLPTILLILLSLAFAAQTNKTANNYKLHQDFGKLIQDISDHYIYLENKKTDFDCVKDNYSKIISKVKSDQEKILFFEYLLSEFYDNNLALDAKTKYSFRLQSPLYVSFKNNKFFITNIWFSQLESFGKNILGAEVLNFNSKEFHKVVDKFPVQCVDKNIPEVREWIANKIISGRNIEQRILTLELTDGRKISLNIDKIKIREDKKLFSVRKKNGIAVIRFNNSLGDINLIKRFDNQLNSLMGTKGLIIDLRNTKAGSNDYIAKAIMSRFIAKDLPYQKYVSKEKYANTPEITKSGLEFVSPRGLQYKKPIVVLVGKWTGSVGESLAVGLDGMNRARIVGTEMKRFVGSTTDYSFKNKNYGYQITTNKLYHINGIKRENFIPEFNITQESILNDDVLEKAYSLFEFINRDNFVTGLKTKNNIVSKVDK